jgi:hypothetical protein
MRSTRETKWHMFRTNKLLKPVDYENRSETGTLDNDRNKAKTTSLGNRNENDEGHSLVQCGSPSDTI